MLKGWWKVSVKSSTLQKLDSLKNRFNLKTYDEVINYMIEITEKSNEISFSRK